MAIKTFKDLIVWQKSMSIVEDIYLISIDFPDEEKHTLTSQIRRSAVSIPSNIAEGYGRNSKKDYKRFLQIAKGSLFELMTQLEISFNLTQIERFFRRIGYSLLHHKALQISSTYLLVCLWFLQNLLATTFLTSSSKTIAQFRFKLYKQ